MKLLVKYEEWELIDDNGKLAHSGKGVEMSDEYVEHLKACFEEDYNEKVEIVYVDEEKKLNEFAIIRN